MKERRSVVSLTNGSSIDAQESVQEIQDLVANAPGHDPLFIELTDRRGKTHMVNLREVAEFYEPQESGGANIRLS